MLDKFRFFTRLKLTSNNSHLFSILKNNLSNGNHLNLAFFGSDNFSLDHFKHLHEVYPVTFLITTSRNTPLYKHAKYLVKNLYTWDELKSQNFNIFAQNRPDLSVVVSFGRIFPESIIKKLHSPILNVHPSLLPRWRGASPIFHTILSGDKITGITIFQIADSKIDTGKILSYKIIPLKNSNHNSTSSLMKELIPHSNKLLISTIKNLDKCIENKFGQDSVNLATTYAPKPKKEYGFIDFKQLNANQINQMWRALNEMKIPLKCIYDNREIYIMDSTYCIGQLKAYNQVLIHFLVIFFKQPNDHFLNLSKLENLPSDICEEGRLVILRHGSNNNLVPYLFIRCKNSWLAVSRLKFANHKPLSAIEFYNGYLHKRRKSSVRLASSVYSFGCFTCPGPNPIIPFVEPLSTIEYDIFPTK